MFTNDFAMEDFTSSSGTDGLTADQLVSTNWQTTAAVGLTVATGGVTGAIMLAAFPAQTIAATGGIATLAYAGKRRADGKAAFPFMDKDSNKKSVKKSNKTESKKEDKQEEEATASSDA